MRKRMRRARALPMRRKLFCYGALFTLAFFVICAVLLANLNNVSSEYQSVSAIQEKLREGNASVQEAHQLLSGMIACATPERADEFFHRLDRLERHFRGLTLRVRDYETYYLYQGLLNMLDAYEVKSGALIGGLLSRSSPDTQSLYARLNDIAANIIAESERLSVRLYSQSGALSASITRQMLLFNICLPAFSVFIAIYSIGILAHLNRRFVGPIRQLTGIAQSISAGDYPREKLVFEDDSDFNILAETMYGMSTTIRENIEEINNRARIMQELNAQQIENLRIKSMYNQLELRRLQEQINPHFLFNCLSTLHHTAYLEGANRTCDICSAIASLLRYNFRQCDTTVTLTREMENLANFTYLQDKICQGVSLPINIRGVLMSLTS